VAKLWQIHNCVDILAMGNVVEKHFRLCKDFNSRFYDWNWTCYKKKYIIKTMLKY